MGYFEIDLEKDTKVYVKYEVSEEKGDAYITQEEYDARLASFNADETALNISNEVDIETFLQVQRMKKGGQD